MDDPRQFFNDTPNAKLAAKLLDIAALLTEAEHLIHQALLTLRTAPHGPYLPQLMIGIRLSVSAVHSTHLPEATKLRDAFDTDIISTKRRPSMARERKVEQLGDFSKGTEPPFEVIVKNGFQPPLKKHCRECPLARTATPGYLGGYTDEEYVQILQGEASIACHLSPGFPDVIETQRHCTGVAAYRANTCKLPKSNGARQAVDLIGQDKDRFFGSAKEFREHHHAANASVYGEHGEKR